RVREDEAGAEVGAFHGAEYAYVFGVHDDYMTTTETDLALEETMQRYWVQFATTGDPNSPDTPTWPRFAAPDYPVQELGDTVFAKAAPEPELCALFEAWHAENYARDAAVPTPK
ncbi:MAG: carboxylesterase family protein, partial [Gammaproteobacteria bacterium]|nr:carboxylesterase family protein [Gammaproteobacteria bacterium]